MPAKQLTPQEKVKAAKSATEQANLHAIAVEKTAKAEERVAKATEKRTKAQAQGIKNLDEYNKAILEANESLEQHQKEQEAVGKGTAKLSGQYSRNFVKAIQDSGTVASKSFAKLDKKGQDLWYHQADAARKYAKEGKTVQRAILESQMEINNQINKLSGDKSKVTKEQLSTLQSQIKTEEQLATLNEEDRANAIQINALLKKKLAYMDAAVDAQNEMNEAAKGFTKYLDMAKDIMKKMKTPGGAIMMILTAVAALLKKGLESVKNINEQLGVGVVESGKMAANLAAGAKTSYALGFGKNIENAAAASANISGNLDLATNSALAVSDAAIAMQTGLSSDNVAELAEGLAVTTDLTREGASAMLGSVASFAKMNKVAPKKVMEDLANSAETLAKYSDGTAEGMARAAVHAAKLGLNLNKVGSVADNLLDLETSIAAEFEAEVLTGKDLNLDRARQLALNNDLEGVMNEIVNQVGSEAEFQKMNAIERESLAKAVGMSTEDLAKVMSKGAGAEIGGNFEDKSLKGQGDLIKQGVVMEDKADKIINLIMGVIAAILGGQMLSGLSKLLPKSLRKVLSKAPGKAMDLAKKTKPGKWVGNVAKKGLNVKPANLMKAGGFAILGEVGKMAGDAGEKYFRDKGMENAARASDIGGKAAKGMGYGAAVGSIIPGIGTAVGAAVGGTIGAGIGIWQNYNKEIKAFFSDAGANAKKYASVAKAKAIEMVATAKEKWSSMVKGAKDRLSEMKKNAINNFQGMKDKATAVAKALPGMVSGALSKAGALHKSFVEKGGLVGAAKSGWNFLKELVVGSKESGGPIRKTGSYLVGEAGPELVNRSAGSSVVPNKYMGGMQEGQFGSVDTESIVAAINSLKADLNAIKANTGTTSEGVNRIKIGAAA